MHVHVPGEVCDSSSGHLQQNRTRSLLTARGEIQPPRIVGTVCGRPGCSLVSFGSNLERVVCHHQATK